MFKRILKASVSILLTLAITLITTVRPVGAAPALPTEQFEARAAILMDPASSLIMFEKEADKQLPIASVTKVMTLLLIFEAIDAGKLTPDTLVNVSENASGMGGSQVYLEAGATYSVETLIKSIIVASANDACVAMAEAIAGSQSVFVTQMNERAAELGMQNTAFKNPTGLPEEGHFSSARDVALMSTELIKHEYYFKFSKIWLDTVDHPEGRITQITNTNKLIRQCDGVDGIKTGRTDEALNCLSASAKRGDMRLIAVVLGEPTSQIRFDEAKELLEYGFANYETKQLVEKGRKLATITVLRGKEKAVAAVTSDALFTTLTKGDAGEIEIKLDCPNIINAPVKNGQKLGTAAIHLNGTLLGEIDLVASNDVEIANLFDIIMKVLSCWR